MIQIIGFWNEISRIEVCVNPSFYESGKIPHESRSRAKGPHSQWRASQLRGSKKKRGTRDSQSQRFAERFERILGKRRMKKKLGTE